MSNAAIYILILRVIVSAALAAQGEWTSVERVVAVGDVHGDYAAFVSVLRSARLIDDKTRWIGGKAHLVCPSDLAYGDAGSPPIPGGATLIFDIELLGIVGK